MAVGKNLDNPPKNQKAILGCAIAFLMILIMLMFGYFFLMREIDAIKAKKAMDEMLDPNPPVNPLPLPETRQ